MKEYSNLESYAEHVKDETCSIMAMLCRELGPEHRITVRVLGLLNEAGGIVHQRQMQREQSAPDRFSLATLNVHAETPSNSETGWERED